MKRILNFIAVVMMFVTAMAQNSGIVLSYDKGKELKFYSAKGLNKAIEDAEVNDTIYLGKGEISFGSLPLSYGHRCISKPLTIIGSGAHSEGTKITDCTHVCLEIDPSLEDSKKKFSLEGMRFPNLVLVASDIKELKFANAAASFSDQSVSEEVAAVVDSLVIDRCEVPTLNLGQFRIPKAIVCNTKITSLYGGTDTVINKPAVLDHCFAKNIAASFRGLIQHSLIENIAAGDQSTLSDCYYRSDTGSSVILNSKKLATTQVAELDEDPSSLENCADKTAYGTLGGLTPFTLHPQYPIVDTSLDPQTNRPKSFVEYDSQNKTLTITVTPVSE